MAPAFAESPGPPHGEHNLSHTTDSGAIRFCSETILNHLMRDGHPDPVSSSFGSISALAVAERSVTVRSDGGRNTVRQLRLRNGQLRRLAIPSCCRGDRASLADHCCPSALNERMHFALVPGDGRRGFPTLWSAAETDAIRRLSATRPDRVEDRAWVSRGDRRDCRGRAPLSSTDHRPSLRRLSGSLVRCMGRQGGLRRRCEGRNR